MKTLNYSRQRQAILDFLWSSKDHPTAEDIYRNVRNELPNISLGTVYRNLNLLAGIGTIRKVHGLGDTVHFDADISEHQHFICQNCGNVQDVFLRDPALLPALNANAGRNFEGTITKNDIYFYGLCDHCYTEQEATEPR